MTRCRDIMTSEIITCTPTTTLVGAAAIMRDEDFGSLPVVEEDGTLIGIITDRDIVVRGLAEHRVPTETTVADVMSRDIETCRENDEIEAAMDRMRRAQIRRIPIVNDNNQIVGIIAQADLAVRTERTEDVGQVVEDISYPS